MTTGASDSARDRLLERDQEVAQIELALAAARSGDGAFVLIEGPAGIGKTALIQAARRLATAAGLTVATARGSELERELALGVVRQLLEPPLARADEAGRAELLAGAAALVAPIFAAEADLGVGSTTAESQYALLHGLYWLCANLAQAGPLLLAVDDAHWADVDSLGFLAYLVNRIEGLPLTLVTATRPAETPAEEEVLGRLAADPRTVCLEPAPLTPAAVTELLNGGLDSSPDAAFAEACHAATGGTPFLVRELIREVRAHDLPPVAASVTQVAQLGPRAIARAVVRRVRRAGHGALEVARGTAVLGAEAEPHRLARVAGMAPSSVSAALDALAAAGVLTPGRPIAFVHPIVRSALYREMPTGERERLHAAAAQLLAEERVVEERVATHVLASNPTGDPHAVELLLRTARTAFARGAPGSAAAYLERALAEPPSGEALVEVLHELGRTQAARGSDAFAETLRRAIGVCRHAERRALIALDLGGALAHAGAMSAAVTTFEAAIDGIAKPNSPLALRLEGQLLRVALYHYPSRDAIARRLARRVNQLDAGELDEPALLAALGRWSAESRPPARTGAEIADRATREPLEVGSWVPGGVGGALLCAGMFARAVAYLDATSSYARSRGWRLSVAWAETWHAALSLLQGDLARAEADARLALEGMRDPAVAGTHTAFVWASAVLIEALLARGAVEDAVSVLADAGDVEEHPPTYWRSLLIAARGRLHLAQGDPSGALADAFASAPPFGDRVNPVARPWRSDAAWALRALGRVADGLQHAEAELRDARAFAVPYAVGVALRAVAACSPNDDAVLALEEAVEALEHSEAALEHARALVDLGAALRRRNQRSQCQAPLRQGLDLAHRCGAHPLAERARAELLATGARPRRKLLTGVDALTASERRVAEMAATGLTNREVAQALFITQRTVETHLTQAFRKLDITSRANLATSLARDEPGERPARRR